MSFGEAINTCIRKYAVFRGRAGRTEYWSWVLACVFAEVLVAAVAQDDYWTWTLVFELITVLPTLAVGCRRLHDSDRSGWWQLVGLVPIIGDVALIVLTCLPCTPGPNRFGPARV